MSISGLVITLADEPDRAAGAVREILLAGQFMLGEVFGHRVTLALEADTPAEAEHWHRWLADRPGVLKVDVAFVHLELAAEEATHAH